MVEYREKCSDCGSPVLDITFTNTQEAFGLGEVFEKIVSGGSIVWKGDSFIRIKLTRREE